MHAPTMEITPLEYVAASKREQAQGNHQKAAALMWRGTQAAFAALAEANGVECPGLEYGDLLRVAEDLEAKLPVGYFYYRTALGPGSLLKDHAELEALESYQLDLAFELAEEFILECDDGA